MSEPDSEEVEGGTIPARRVPSARRRCLVLTLALLLGPLLAEGYVRFLLFHESALARKLGQGWRRAQLFGDPALDDEYWILSHLFGARETQSMPPGIDPLLGWRGNRLLPESYRLLQEPELRGRRPVLLFGASFAQCMTPAEDCFEGWMERSELAGEYCLLNYGVGGYGIDQVYLLLQRVIDLYAELDPIVVLADVADSDFERAWLSFRDWPKPRLELVDDRLVDVSSFRGSREEYLRQRGTGIRSYAWRAALHGEGLLPASWRAALTGRERRLAEQGELIRAIVRAIASELDGRGLDWFFLLCNSRAAMQQQEPMGMERFLAQLFHSEGIRYVASRPYFEAELAAHGKKHLWTLYIPHDQRGANHPTAAGNELLFRALGDGIQGHFSGSATEPAVEER